MLIDWPSASCLTPAALTVEIWTKTSLPPSSPATKPKPLVSSNHLTLPLRGTAVEGSGRRGPRPGRAAGDARNERSTMPEASISTMLATCGPLGPAATITRSLAPGGTDSRPIGLQDVHVKERVAVAVGQLDEAVAFLLIEPFDDAGEALAALRRGRGAERRRSELDCGVVVKPGGPWPRPMGKRFIVIEGVLARRPGIPVLIHKTETFRSGEIKERRPSIMDAASSRRTSAKPRDGAEIAPKIREPAASPIWILWSETGGRGGGDGIRAGGTDSPSRLAGGSGAPWLERARPNAATARRKSAIVSVSNNPGRRAPSAPQLGPPASARRTLGNLSPDNMKGTIDGSRPEPRRRVSTADQIKCSASDDVFLPTA